MRVDHLGEACDTDDTAGEVEAEGGRRLGSHRTFLLPYRQLQTLHVPCYQRYQQTIIKCYVTFPKPSFGHCRLW